MGEPYDLDALIEDRSRGHLLRWVQAIDAGFAGGGDAKAKVLEAYAERTSSDFWHFMVETAEGKSAPPSGWAVEAARRVVEHNRGMCAASFLDQDAWKGEVLMSTVQRVLREILGDEASEASGLPI